jgi:hypothetical protein
MMADTLCSAQFTATGSVLTCDTNQPVGRVRIKSVYYTASANGAIVLRDGGANGVVRMTFSTTSSASGLVIVPGEGILFNGTPHATVTGTLTGATVFYG